MAGAIHASISAMSHQNVIIPTIAKEAPRNNQMGYIEVTNPMQRLALAGRV
jgi:hypothetical protein